MKKFILWLANVFEVELPVEHIEKIIEVKVYDGDTVNGNMRVNGNLVVKGSLIVSGAVIASEEVRGSGVIQAYSK